MGLREVDAVLEGSCDLGLREFDTAPNYGNGFAEFALGKVFGGRHDVQINTKCGNAPFVGKSFAPLDLRRSLEQSLVRLRRDSVHVLFLHNPRWEIEDYAEVLELLERLKQEGLVEKSGISLARDFPYEERVDLDAFDVVQDDANLLCTAGLERPLASSTCFMARSPLASGLLGGHIDAQTRFPAEDHRSGWLVGERLELLAGVVESIRDRWDVPISRLARKFLFQHPRVDRVILGVRTLPQLEEAVEDLAAPVVPAQVFDEIAELYAKALVGRENLGY